VQIGALTVPPQPGVGDVNNYTFWYYTTARSSSAPVAEIE
jgi:hypothetical protein